MHVLDIESVELSSYQLKGISRVWYDQSKNSRAKGAPILSSAVFDELFLTPRIKRSQGMGIPYP